MGYEILKDNHQKLYIESAKAEKYIETDFETSIEKVNKILEVLCKKLYQKHYNEELDYVEIINVLYDNGYLSSEDKSALHDIRKKRNSIIHEGNEATEGFAKWAYKAGENISYNIINCIKRTVDIDHKAIIKIKLLQQSKFSINKRIANPTYTRKNPERVFHLSHQ